MLQPSNILNKKFKRTKMFGYKTEDVDNFFAQVADEYQRLCETNEILEQKICVLANEIENNKNSANSLGNILIEAKKLADSILAKAKEQAESMLREAKARAESEISSIKFRIAKEQNTLLNLQREAASFKTRITNMYKSHLDLINNLPSMPSILNGGLEEYNIYQNLQTSKTKTTCIENEAKSEEQDKKTMESSMEKTDINEPVTKQINLNKIFQSKLKKDSTKEQSDNENENNKISSKFGILQFGEKHKLTKKSTGKKHSLFGFDKQD